MTFKPWLSTRLWHFRKSIPKRTLPFYMVTKYCQDILRLAAWWFFPNYWPSNANLWQWNRFLNISPDDWLMYVLQATEPRIKLTLTWIEMILRYSYKRTSTYELALASLKSLWLKTLKSYSNYNPNVCKVIRKGKLLDKSSRNVTKRV